MRLPWLASATSPVPVRARPPGERAAQRAAPSDNQNHARRTCSGVSVNVKLLCQGDVPVRENICVSVIVLPVTEPV